jgi:hypothetical protein
VECLVDFILVYLKHLEINASINLIGTGLLKINKMGIDA